MFNNEIDMQCRQTLLRLHRSAALALTGERQRGFIYLFITKEHSQNMNEALVNKGSLYVYTPKIVLIIILDNYRSLKCLENTPFHWETSVSWMA